MSANSKIEWCDSTFNPWIGCIKVSPGCDNCYAAQQDKFRNWTPEGWGGPRKLTKTWGDPVKWNKAHAAFFAAHGRRQRVFCASLADVFDNEVDPQWRADLFDLIGQTPNLDWLLLTKRIGNAAPMITEAISRLRLGGWKQMPWPWPNVWLGATVVNQEEADRDIPKLLATPARVRFLSMEPLLGPVDLSRIDIDGHSEIYPLRGTTGCEDDDGNPAPDMQAINWIIAGGESGPGARPSHPDWYRGLRDQCQAAGLPFLFKQWGEWLPTTGADFCRSRSAPEHAAFREKNGRGGYEHAGKEGTVLLRDGRICRTDPAGDQWRRGAGTIVDREAMECFYLFVKTGKDDPGAQWLYRVGKKAAGRLLDDIEHNGAPS